MGIKVKLNDGTVEVGGEFKSALAWVKSFEGRQYDPATKTWTVPTTLREFDKKNSRFPMDVLSGNGSSRTQTGDHHTRYGNVWAEEEWDAQKKVWATEGKIGQEYAGEYEEAENQLRNNLKEAGVSEAGINMIVSRVWDFSDMIEFGKFQFTSKEREAEITAIVEEYYVEFFQITEAEQNEIDAQTERIWEETGIL